MWQINKPGPLQRLLSERGVCPERRVRAPAESDVSLLLLSCRQQRLAEWKATKLKNKFGEVLEISETDHIQEVTKAGKGLWVILYFYKQGIPPSVPCGLVRKFPDVEFIKATSTTCVSNYPDSNLPTTFVYLEDNIKAQSTGPPVFGGMNLTIDELECKLSLERSRQTWRKTLWNQLRTHCYPQYSALSL